MRAAIYVHTASTNPELRNHQIARCKQLAAREGYHVVLIMADTGYGAQQDRPGLQHLRALIEGDALDAVIAWDYTHLSRQPEEVHKFLAFCRLHNVQMCAVNRWTGAPAERAVGV